MDLTIVNTLAVRGMGTASVANETTIKAEDLESLILAIADERDRAGDTFAAIALERISRLIAHKWPLLETIDSEIENAREAGIDEGYEIACVELSDELDDARDALEYWSEYAAKQDPLPRPDSRKLARTQTLVRQLRGY